MFRAGGTVTEIEVFEVKLNHQGLEWPTIDATYENFVRQIAGDSLKNGEGKTESLKESVERANRQQELKALKKELNDIV